MMTTEDFIACMERDLSARTAELLSGKPEQEKYLTLAELRQLAGNVQQLCADRLGETPWQVQSACLLAEAILAPMNEKTGLLKKVYALAGGMKGTDALISAVGNALGWSRSVLTLVIAFYLGFSWLGAIGVAALVGYFLFHGSPSAQSERALGVLQQGVRAALKAYFKANPEKRPTESAAS